MWESETFKFLISTLLAPIIAALAAVLTHRWSKSREQQEGEQKSLDAKTEFDISQSAEAIAKGSTVQIENFLRTIEFMRLELDSLRENKKNNDKELQELRLRIQADLIETQNLRNEYANAQKRIINLEGMVIRVSEYAEGLTKSLKAADIPVPLNGELMDSVIRLKTEISNRNK